MQVKRFVVGSILSWVVATSVQAAEAAKRALSLAECIQIALEHNLDVKIERYSPELAGYGVRLAYGAYDPEFNFGAQKNYSLSPGGLDSQSRPFQGSETDTDSLGGGFRGLLPTGLSYSLTLGTTDSNGTRPAEVPDFSASPIIRTNFVTDALDGNRVLGFLTTNYPTRGIRVPFENSSARGGIAELRQPLLKNLWIDSARYNILVSKNRLRYTEHGLRLRIMTTIQAVQTAYYNLIQARENVKNQEKALELARTLFEQNKKRVEVGAMAKLDEKQAESQVAQRQADLLGAQNNLYIQENALKTLLSDNFPEWSSVTIEPTESLAAELQPFDVQESWHKGLNKRPELAQMKLDLDRVGIQLRYEKNQLFPQLDVFGSYGWLASGPEFNDALDRLSRGDSPYYSLGTDLRIPLGNRVARLNYKMTKTEREQLLLRAKKLEQEIMVEIDNAVKQAQTAYESVKATRDAEAYAEEALRAEEKKLENGKSTSFVVLQLQRDLTFARTAAINALAGYNRALAQLAFSEGTTLERNNLTLEVK
jgi:outer membrane protein TolC